MKLLVGDRRRKEFILSDQFSRMALGMAVGIGVGAVIGAALDNVPIGIAIGIALGAAGAIFAARSGK